MTQDVWTAVDRYFDDLFVPSDEALDGALRAMEAAGLPAINVTAGQGQLLMLLARLGGARRILEIGTLGGYSTIWLARALAPGGRVVTLEAEPRHAEVAAGSLAAAGLDGVVEIRIGPALDTLPKLAAEGLGPFDVVFIDADKEHNADYVEWALRLSRPGTLVIVDNVVRHGAVVDPARTDSTTEGVRRMARLMAAEPRLTSVAVQTVGSKGYDGLILALVDGRAANGS